MNKKIELLGSKLMEKYETVGFDLRPETKNKIENEDETNIIASIPRQV